MRGEEVMTEKMNMVKGEFVARYMDVINNESTLAQFAIVLLLLKIPSLKMVKC